MTEPTPKHCPICESTDVTDITDESLRFYVICYDCGLETGRYSTEEEAIAAWNNRKGCQQLSDFHRKIIELTPEPDNEEYEVLIDQEAKEGDKYLDIGGCCSNHWRKAAVSIQYRILRRPKAKFQIGDGFEYKGGLHMVVRDHDHRYHAVDLETGLPNNMSNCYHMWELLELYDNPKRIPNAELLG